MSIVSVLNVRNGVEVHDDLGHMARIDPSEFGNDKLVFGGIVWDNAWNGQDVFAIKCSGPGPLDAKVMAYSERGSFLGREDNMDGLFMTLRMKWGLNLSMPSLVSR